MIDLDEKCSFLSQSLWEALTENGLFLSTKKTDLLEIAMGIKLSFRVTDERAFSVALLDDYITLKINEDSKKKGSYYPDAKTLLAYKVRNALLDPKNKSRDSAKIIADFVGDIMNFKGWSSHRFFTVMEIVQHEKEYPTSSIRVKAKDDYVLQSIKGDIYVRKLLSSFKTADTLDFDEISYDEKNIKEIEELSNLEDEIGLDKADLVQKLKQYIINRQRTPMNREGIITIRYAKELMQRLIIDSSFSLKDIANMVIDPANRVLKAVDGLHAYRYRDTLFSGLSEHRARFKHPLAAIVDSMRTYTDKQGHELGGKRPNPRR